jgi:hypothetical protein
MMLDNLSHAKVFTTLYLASGYWQVVLAPEHRWNTAFVTPDGGHYEFLRLPSVQRPIDISAINVRSLQGLERQMCPALPGRSPHLLTVSK